jgi:hypothetical protein
VKIKPLKGKERYAYIVLVILALGGAFTAIVLSINQVHVTQQKFCHLVAISNANPPQIRTERSIAMFRGYQQFGLSIGCNE